MNIHLLYNVHVSNRLMEISKHVFIDKRMQLT